MFLKSWFRNMPVKRKILLPGLTGLLVMIVVITGFWSLRLSSALNSGFEDKVRLTEAFISAPLATAAWNYDGELAETTLTSLADQQAFVFARVLSGSDTLAELVKSGEMQGSWEENANYLLQLGETSLQEGGLTFYRTPLVFDGEQAGNLIWALDTTIVQAQIEHAIIIAASLGVGIVALFAVVFYFIALAVSKPISAVVKHIDALQEGNLDVEIPEAARRDEIGALGKALSDFRDATVETRRMEEQKRQHEAAQARLVEILSEALGKLSAGDLTVKIQEAFPPEYEKLRKDFNALVTRLFDTVSAVVEAADSIQNGSNEISSASDDLARRTESQAATLEETAAALDELTASVRQAADGAQSVSETMERAKAEAVNSGTVVNSAVSAMTEIEQSSTHISQIIGVIDDIAFQTNLLALNAGVEAARAGEAGRGFAVVASEVRALAQRSSDAAMEIKTLIGDSSKQVERGVDLVGKAGGALHSIVEQVTQISGLISEIARGAGEQSSGLGDINSGMIELDQVTQQNAAMVEEATAASHMLKANAQNLATMVGHFKLTDNSNVKPMGRPAETKAAQPKAAQPKSAAPKPASASAAKDAPSAAKAASAAAQRSPSKPAARAASEFKSAPAPSAHGDDWDYTPEPTKIAVGSDAQSAKIWEDF